MKQECGPHDSREPLRALTDLLSTLFQEGATARPPSAATAGERGRERKIPQITLARPRGLERSATPTTAPNNHPKAAFPQLFHRRLSEDSPTHLGFDPLLGETALGLKSRHRAEPTSTAAGECSPQTIPAQRVLHHDK